VDRGGKTARFAGMVGNLGPFAPGELKARSALDSCSQSRGSHVLLTFRLLRPAVGRAQRISVRTDGTRKRSSSALLTAARGGDAAFALEYSFTPGLKAAVRQRGNMNSEL
jgi:hypothetical protein